MTREDLKTGAIVRHFKYETLTQSEKAEKMYLYEIIDVALHTESGEQLVVYRALYADRKVYARPIELFLSKTDKKKYPQIKQKYRFQIIDS